ncbi:leucine-rich alpha-2-glycoprotein-like isoform X1 [Dermacentor albipictus]|uniref:leucine-rich alpha-2-glycoprotein-like isoform X1 n=2 Tax=Dermacentor albipictus TaxID=60249 RepID=UPI0031FD4287
MLFSRRKRGTRRRDGASELVALVSAMSVVTAQWLPLDCSKFGHPSGPCNCTVHNNTPNNLSRHQVWITCVNVSSLEQLGRILAPARHHHVDKFQLGVSTLGHLPSNLFLDVRASEVHLWDTPLASFVQGDSDDALLGLQDTLRSLALRRCALDSSQPFHRMGHLQALEMLDLSFNQLTTVRASWFKAPLSLRSLLLRANRISRIESGAFAKLYRLLQLDLSQNNIAAIERSMLPDALFFLDLSDNRLTVLSPLLFDKMTSLRRVYLNGNRLTTLDRAVWSAVWSNPRLGVEMHGNPVVCDRRMCWLARLVPRECLSRDCQRSPADYRHLDGRCNAPPPLAGHHLTHVDCDALDCGTECDHGDQDNSLGPFL